MRSRSASVQAPSERAAGKNRPHAENHASANRRAGGPSDPSAETERQKSLSLARPPSRPPPSKPAAKTTAFIAPALAPLTPAIAIRSSSESASSTPQV